MGIMFNDLLNNLTAAFGFAQHQVHHLIASYPDYFPMYTEGGRWKHSGEAWTNWCEGFLGGMMWIFYKRTGDQEWLHNAEHYTRLIEDRKTDSKIHDLGFLFWSTWKRWYDLTNEEAINKVVIRAGQTMGLRFIEKGKYLCSFVAPESLFIDIMMNIGIVFYAAQQTNDEDLLSKAHQHCKTTLRYLVRGDGSTAHEGIFDLDSGEFLHQSTHQGWRGDSTWARGQAWALYGFGTAYGMTKEPSYLDAAIMCADYYLTNTDFTAEARAGAGIPPNDWDDPRRPILYESSAAAIAASGLINLSLLIQDPVHACRYRRAALIILDTLTGPEYLAIQTPDWEGIVKHAVYHQRKSLGVDESVMWGDYFFTEALDKAMNLEDDNECW